jgi:hypothetical protein
VLLLVLLLDFIWIQSVSSNSSLPLFCFTDSVLSISAEIDGELMETESYVRTENNYKLYYII